MHFTLKQKPAGDISDLWSQQGSSSEDHENQ